MLKTLSGSTQTVTTASYSVLGDVIPLKGAKTVSAQCNITVTTPAAKTFAQGTRQVQQIATVADVSGSLNSTYFFLNSVNTSTEAVKGWYVWLNVNSAGVNPQVASRTGIEIPVATGDSANTIATSIRSALDALTSDFASSTGSNQNVIVNNKNPGLVTAAADGTAATGFTFSVPSTAGVDSKVSPNNDTITIAAHGLPTGLILQASDTGTLPTGITTSTDYFVIVVDTNTIKLASSLLNALAGTALNLSTFGSNAGVGTLTPTALASASVQLKKSNDGITYVVDGSAVSVTATGTYWLESVNPTSNYMAVYYTLASGSLSASTVIVTKGDD